MNNGSLEWYYPSPEGQVDFRHRPCRRCGAFVALLSLKVHIVWHEQLEGEWP